MHPYVVSLLFRAADASLPTRHARGFSCIGNNGNPRFATTEYDGTTLSAQAFEIRWKSEDLVSRAQVAPAPRVVTTLPDTSSTVNTTATAAMSSLVEEPEQDPTSSPSPTSNGGA